MNAEELRLDGNAAAGTLADIFARDTTSAAATCAGCGAIAPLGALMNYGHAMGVVLRCTTCDGAVLRIARLPGRVCIDLSGVALLVIPE